MNLIKRIGVTDRENKWGKGRMWELLVFLKETLFIIIFTFLQCGTMGRLVLRTEKFDDSLSTASSSSSSVSDALADV